MAGLQKLKWKASSTASGATLITFPPATITFDGNVVKQVKHSDGTILWGKYTYYSAAEEIDYVIRDAWNSWWVEAGTDLTDTEALSLAPAEGVDAKRLLEEETVPGYGSNSVVYHGEQLTLYVDLNQGWNYGINEIDQATAYWITSKSMNHTVTGDTSLGLDSNWYPIRNYFKTLTISPSGCTLSSFKQSNVNWTNGSKATSGATISFTATPSTTGMIPTTGTYTYTVPEANAPNTNKLVTFYTYWPVSFSGSMNNYGPTSGSKLVNNIGNHGFGGGAGQSMKVALYTNNTSWVSQNAIKCNSYAPSAISSISPSVVTISSKSNLSIGYGAQASSNSSGEIYACYYYNSKCYKMSLRAGTTALVTPTVTLNESSIASNFDWNYDSSEERITWTRAGFAVTNPTGLALQFTVTTNFRFKNNVGSTVSGSKTQNTTVTTVAGTVYEVSGPGYDYGGAAVNDFEVQYTISVKYAGQTITLGQTDWIH